MAMHFEASPDTFKKVKELRDNETPAEKILWTCLSENKLGVKFRRQHPIKWFIADFYCHKAKLIIEVDGDFIQIYLRKNTMRVGNWN